MKRLRIISAFLATVLLMGLLTGCQSGSDNQDAGDDFSRQVIISTNPDSNNPAPDGNVDEDNTSDDKPAVDVGPEVDDAPLVDNDPRAGLIKYDWRGLYYYLGKDMRQTESYYNPVHDNGTLVVRVDGQWLSEAFGESVKTAHRFAELKMAEFEEIYDTVELREENGVPYLLCHHDETAMVCGFYVYASGDWGFYIEASFQDAGVMQTAINYATLGEVHFFPG